MSERVWCRLCKEEHDVLDLSPGPSVVGCPTMAETWPDGVMLSGEMRRLFFVERPFPPQHQDEEGRHE